MTPKNRTLEGKNRTLGVKNRRTSFMDDPKEVLGAILIFIVVFGNQLLA